MSRTARRLSKARNQLGRLGWRHLGTSALVLLVIAAGIGGLLQFRVNTDSESFLPSGDPTVEALQEKARSFGGDPVLVLIESGSAQRLLTDPEQLKRVLELEGRLSGLPNTAATYGPATVLNQVAISAQNMLAQIAGRRDALRATAEEGAKNSGLGPDGIRRRGDEAVAEFEARYGALLVKGLPVGLPTLHNPQFAKNVIYDQSGTPRPQWSFVVPDRNSIALLVRPREGMDQAETQELVTGVRSTVDRAGLESTRVTVTGIPAITAGLSAQVSREVPMIGGLAIILMLVRFFLVPTRTGRLRRLWPLVSGLLATAATLSVFGWLGVPMSFGAVALLPLLLGIGTSFPMYLQITASRRRVVVAAAAAIAAFASLTLSPLPFVDELGMALALGVTFTIGIALALGKRMRPEKEQQPTAARAVTPPPMPRVRRGVLLGLAACLAVGGWAALPQASIQSDPRELARGVPEIEDAQHAERVLGSSGEINVVLRGPDVLGAEAIDWSKRAESSLVAAHGDAIKPALTPSGVFGFLGPSPSAEQVKAGTQLLPQYITSAVIRPDGRESVMNFGIRFQDLGKQSSLISGMRAALPPPPPGYSAEIVGLPVAADRAYSLLSSDRVIGNVAGIAAAGAVLLIGLRRRSDALRGVLAATLATGWAIGALVAAGISLSPLTLVLGVLTAVTATEFTVLLADARRTGSFTTRRLVAWAAATSAVGYLALVPSSLSLLREYGLVLAATVLLSYLAAISVVHLLPSGTGRAHPNNRPAPVATREEIRT